jgi:hypothetical protein
MKQQSVPWLILSVLALAAGSLLHHPEPQRTNACLWDRDTLAMEAEQYPGITEIITGRFDRYPDLYYEMRLERVSLQLKESPGDLSLYDDAGVACDRLGRHDEAILWMSRKRTVLDTLDSPDNEHEYRYLANLGTFHIHRWLSEGADRTDMQDTMRARDLIAAAMDLNPEAHFGRERYQLLAIEWLIGLDEYQDGESQTILHRIPKYRNPHGTSRNELTGLGYDDAVEGLTGLIALGNAWRSLDVPNALAYALSDRGDHILAMVCMQRLNELYESGARSLNPDFNYTLLGRVPGSYEVEPEYGAQIDAWYLQARSESQGHTARRDAYLLNRLEDGEHPDTHPEFWRDWIESTSPPAFPRATRFPPAKDTVLIFALAAGIAALFIWFSRRMKKPQPTPT